MKDEVRKMYYLIIGTNKILEGEVIEDMGKWFKLKEKNFDYSHRIDKFTPVTKKYIKKQSDNIFDLIDRENDLVKIELLGGYFNILGVKTLNGNWKENDRISAIYKPNEKGDYIKVWEAKK